MRHDIFQGLPVPSIPRLRPVYVLGLVLRTKLLSFIQSSFNHSIIHGLNPYETKLAKSTGLKLYETMICKPGNSDYTVAFVRLKG